MGWPHFFYISTTKMIDVCLGEHASRKGKKTLSRFLPSVEASAEVSFLPKLTFKRKSQEKDRPLRPEDIKNVWDWYYLLSENIDSIIQFMKDNHVITEDVTKIGESEVFFGKGLLRVAPGRAEASLTRLLRGATGGPPANGSDRRVLPAEFTPSQPENAPAFAFMLTFDNITGVDQSGVIRVLREMREAGAPMSGLFMTIPNNTGVELSPYFLMPDYMGGSRTNPISKRIARLLAESA